MTKRKYPTLMPASKTITFRATPAAAKVLKDSARAAGQRPTDYILAALNFYKTHVIPSHGELALMKRLGFTTAEMGRVRELGVNVLRLALSDESFAKDSPGYELARPVIEAAATKSDLLKNAIDSKISASGRAAKFERLYLEERAAHEKTRLLLSAEKAKPESSTKISQIETSPSAMPAGLSQVKASERTSGKSRR